MNDNAKRLETAQATTTRKYGAKYVHSPMTHYHLEVVPTGSLTLDYQLGIGGAPYGHAIEVFGANKIGKSSAVGFPILANVQRQGKLPALLAVEPRLVTPEDRAWAVALGLDPDKMLIQYPDTAEQAFEMLRDLVYGDLVDYIMVDSIGGLGSESSAVEGGIKKAYGASGVITAGLNDIMPRLWKNNIGLLLINQQRQTGNFKGNIMYESGGGEALKHHMRIRIHLKPTGTRYTAQVGGDKLVVGQELTAVLLKNNMAQAQNKKANFDFYHIHTDEYGFGIDKGQDVINAGKMSGVIKGGTWLHHDSFPKDKKGEHKINGQPAVKEYLAEHPEAIDYIRDDVMAVMDAEELKLTQAKQAKAAKAAAQNGVKV